VLISAGGCILGTIFFCCRLVVYSIAEMCLPSVEYAGSISKAKAMLTYSYPITCSVSIIQPIV